MWNEFSSLTVDSSKGRAVAQTVLIFFFNLHNGGWNQGPLVTAVT
jgi:hypothetical protein